MSEQDTWSIGDVAARVGLDVDTMRYYERRGVLPRPARDAGVHLIDVLLHLRATGMPLTQIAEFTRLVATDPDGVSDRLDLLRRQRHTVQNQIATWNASLEVIDGKIRDYDGRLHATTPSAATPGPRRPR